MMTAPDVVFTADCGCRYLLERGTAVLRGAVLILVGMCKRHIDYREAHG